MNIQFDIFVLVEGMREGLDPEGLAIFEEIERYFSNLLNPLKEKMDQEEQKNNDCCLMICLLPPEEEWALPAYTRTNKVEIRPFEYSDGLSRQIIESITQNALSFLNNRLQNIVSAFRN